MRFRASCAGRVVSFLAALGLGVCVAYGAAPGKQASTLTQTLNSFIATMSTPEAVSGSGAYSKMQDKYLTLFSAAQRPTDVRTATTENLHLLFAAASIVAFYAPVKGNGERFVHDMILDIKELERRDAAYKSEFIKVYKNLIWDRQFSRARQFYSDHVSHLGALPRIPPYRSEVPKADDNLPSEIVVGTKRDELIRCPVNVSKGVVIIALVDPQCHFCAYLNKALRNYPQLFEQLERHTLWVAPLGGILQFRRLQRWNRSHPHEKIGVIYRVGDWHMITSMAVPQLFFMRDGSVVQTIDGWPKGGHINELEEGLRKIGLPLTGDAPNKSLSHREDEAVLTCRVSSDQRGPGSRRGPGSDLTFDIGSAPGA